ncbi:AbiH family protein [Mycoplasma marinum]|nr:AbiH family protein [Mycoplasma marinum]
MELYIIGNGYDLSWGLKTRYQDFANFVKAKYPHEYKEITKLFSLEYNWSDFEDRIGESFEQLEKVNSLKIKEFQTNNKVFETPPITSKIISDLLKEWIAKIMIDSKPQPIVTKEAVINFNYTEYLKGYFWNNVLNIHEKYNEVGVLQIGHSQSRVIEDKFLKFKKEDFNNPFPDPKVQMNQLSKFPNIALQKLKEFIYGLKINKLIFYGFSFGKQDQDYFDIFDKDIKVIFYHYEPLEECREMIKRVKNKFNNVTFIQKKDRLEL